MADEKGNARVELTVPAQARMLMCVRLATSGILARTQLTLDAHDDVRLAVEEACNCLIQFTGCDVLHLQYEFGDRFISVQLDATECFRCKQTPSEDELYTIRCILMSMVDEVKLSGGSDGISGIQLTKKL